MRLANTLCPDTSSDPSPPGCAALALWEQRLAVLLGMQVIGVSLLNKLIRKPLKTPQSIILEVWQIQGKGQKEDSEQVTLTYSTFSLGLASLWET